VCVGVVEREDKEEEDGTGERGRGVKEEDSLGFELSLPRACSFRFCFSLYECRWLSNIHIEKSHMLSYLTSLGRELAFIFEIVLLIQPWKYTQAIEVNYFHIATFRLRSIIHGSEGELSPI